MFVRRCNCCIRSINTVAGLAVETLGHSSNRQLMSLACNGSHDTLPGSTVPQATGLHDQHQFALYWLWTAAGADLLNIQ